MTGDDPEASARRRRHSQLASEGGFRSPAAAVAVELAACSRPAPGRTVNEDQYLVVRLGRQQKTLATSLRAADLPPTYDEQGFAMLVGSPTEECCGT